MARVKNAARPNGTSANLGFESKLWEAADKMRSNMDPGEYKHVVLGLLFLKYINDAFAERRAFLEIARDKQTTGLGHITAADMKRLLVARPPSELVAAFHDIAGPLFERHLRNDLQSHPLAALRDTLLPKLLSGDVRIPAEAFA